MKRILIGLSLCLGGCGIEFDPGSEVNSLRVFAVQKDRPYARPGEDVTLRMLWHDGSETPRPVQRLWLSGCFNPPADQYSGCFSSFAGVSPDPGNGAVPPGVTVGQGDEFSFKLPDDIIDSRPLSPDPNQPAFGVSFVFFAACAGSLEFGGATTQAGFPVRCVGEDGSFLGGNDFVAGYSQIFAYSELRNENPIITGFEFNGAAVTPDCIDAQCLGLETPVPDCGVSPELCVSACEKDGDAKCPEVVFRPTVDKASAEPDAIAVRAGRNFQEQVWVTYYAERGSVSSGARLVNDAVLGFNEDYATKLRAPKATGPLRLWAAVRDNRGGASWARLTVVVN